MRLAYHNYIKDMTPGKQLNTVYKLNVKPNIIYMALMRSDYIHYQDNNSFAASNAKKCIENPAEFVEECASTTPYISNIIDGHWTSAEGDFISDNIRTLTFCAMNGVSMHPIKGIIYNDPKLDICSIDSAGNVHFYKTDEISVFSRKEIGYSMALPYVYTDTLTESHTLEEFQQICKMLEMPFPCLI